MFNRISRTCSLLWVFSLVACVYHHPVGEPIPEIDDEAHSPTSALPHSLVVAPLNPDTAGETKSSSITSLIDVKAVEQSPVVIALLQRADAMAQQGRYDLAAQHAERAIRFEPKSATAYQILARIRFQQQDYEAAEQLAKRALSLLPQTGPIIKLRKKAIWVFVSDVRLAVGDADGAEQALKRADVD